MVAIRLQLSSLSLVTIAPRWTMRSSSWMNSTGKIARKRWTLRASSTPLLAQRPSPIIRRTFSSTNTYYAPASKAKPATTNDDSFMMSSKPAKVEDDEEIVLFYRNPADTSRTLFLLRSGCLFSTFHTGYWMWYNTDFIPLVNQSPIPELHIDPLLGIGGLTFAAVMQIAFFLYPSRLLSAVAIRPATRELVVYAHRFPLLRPSLSPSRRFVIPPDDNKNSDVVAPLTLSPTDIQTLQDTGFATYRGHLTLGSKWPRYTMDIQSAKDIVAAPDVLWDALVQPAVLFGQQQQQQQHTSNHHPEDYDDDDATDSSSPTSSWKRRRRKVVRKSGKKWQRKRK